MLKHDYNAIAGRACASASRLPRQSCARNGSPSSPVFPQYTRAHGAEDRCEEAREEDDDDDLDEENCESGRERLTVDEAAPRAAEHAGGAGRGALDETHLAPRRPNRR